MSRNPFFVQRVKPRPTEARAGGFRMGVPLMFWRRRGYDINVDDFGDGWWAFNVALAIEQLGFDWVSPDGSAGKQRHGLQVQITWGWMPLAVTYKHPVGTINA